MRQSKSRAANCYDTASLDSCVGTVKTEHEMTEYQNYQAAHREITEYLHYYLQQRKHSALGYLTPAQFELLHRTKS
jgi:transposase InsO family protein